MPRWLWLITVVALIARTASVAINARQSWLYAWISGACEEDPSSKYCTRTPRVVGGAPDSPSIVCAWPLMRWSPIAF